MMVKGDPEMTAEGSLSLDWTTPRRREIDQIIGEDLWLRY